MRYATSSAKSALTLALPFILAHCALVSDRLPLKYDEKSVGGPNSSAPLQLYLPPGSGPFPAVLVMHSCSGITDNTGNPEAATDSFAMTKAFLDARLKSKQERAPRIFRVS